MDLRIAIVGCPNVGKSSLFNRLIGSKASIVDSEAKVTRDRVEESFQLDKKNFILIDTAAVDLDSKRKIDIKAKNQTQAAVVSADTIFLVIDDDDAVYSNPTEKNELLRFINIMKNVDIHFLSTIIFFISVVVI